LMVAKSPCRIALSNFSESSGIFLFFLGWVGMGGGKKNE